jgi:hypothetical protein
MNKSVSPARYGCLRLFGAQAFLASDQYSLGSLDFDRNRKFQGLAQKESHMCLAPLLFTPGFGGRRPSSQATR